MKDKDEGGKIYVEISYHFGLCGGHFTPEDPSEVFIGHPGTNMIFDTFEEFIAWERNDVARGSSTPRRRRVDVSELCGGAADTALLLVRRGMSTVRTSTLP